MNRRDRRAAIARGKIPADAGVADLGEAIEAAQRAFRDGAAAQAEDICKRILARAPAHGGALNLLGLVYQAGGRHRLAVRFLAKALAADDRDAGSHYHIARSYQLLDDDRNAARHFKTAVALGLGGRSVEEFALRNKAVVDCIDRLRDRQGFPAGDDEVIPSGALAAIADDVFLRCALESTIFSYLPLENLFTHLRRVLLRLAHDQAARADGAALALYCALAQQCFVNEYVYLQGEDEGRQADELRESLSRRLAAGANGVSALVVAAVASYFPLHCLPAAATLLEREWPACVADLLRRQIREPLQEADDRPAIPALTPIDDDVSLQVMRQYEENPYPRWTLHIGPKIDQSAPGEDILVAGCGTGKQAIRIAQFSPRSRILAVDVSRASLAYARRKSRETGVQNVEYAQADILRLGDIGCSFDRIEAVGVLHHLADPKAGWRVLLSLLRPRGVMRLGLYSETGRRAYAEAFALIAERGYHGTAEDIRKLRQAVIGGANEPRWDVLIKTADFYNMSGCRDLLFNVMEHRLTIRDIAGFLDEQALAFAGFELDPFTLARVREQYQAADALTDLRCWEAFEAAHPQTFLQMYRFSIRKKGTTIEAASCANAVVSPILPDHGS